jgi:hypothetical protein
MTTEPRRRRQLRAKGIWIATTILAVLWGLIFAVLYGIALSYIHA